MPSKRFVKKEKKPIQKHVETGLFGISIKKSGFRSI